MISSIYSREHTGELHVSRSAAIDSQSQSLSPDHSMEGVVVIGGSSVGVDSGLGLEVERGLGGNGIEQGEVRGAGIGEG